MPPGPRYLLHVALLLTLAVAPSPLRAQSDVTPLDPYFRRLPEIARRTGELNCERGRAEAYGMSVHMIEQGRLDQRPRWAVEHILCDTAVTAKELLMYEGGADTIPAVSLASRIGPTEINSFTSFLTSADLDQDGHSDLVCAVRIIGDTAFGNQTWHPTRVVVFWGQPDGRFTLADTSQVPAMGLLWQEIPRDAVVLESEDDSTHLLVVANLSDYVGGNRVQRYPPLRIVSLRHGERWGRDGVQCRPVWTMWGRPPVGIGGCVMAMDHDGDGNQDVVFYDNVASYDSAGWVCVLYGRSAGLPDSNDLQTVYMTAARGRSSLLQDITGDGVPELVVHCGNDEVLRIYIGIRGRRLLEQYGSGADTARPGDPEWWGRPWATLRLPRAFWTGWGMSDRWIYDLGDGDGDGLADIWVVSSAYLLCYTTGEWLDEYADGLYDLVPGTTYYAADYPEAFGRGELLGGRGGEEKILGITSGVRYLGIDPLLPHADRRIHRLPPGTGKPTTAAPLREPWPWRMDLW